MQLELHIVGEHTSSGRVCPPQCRAAPPLYTSCTSHYPPPYPPHTARRPCDPRAALYPPHTCNTSHPSLPPPSHTDGSQSNPAQGDWQPGPTACDPHHTSRICRSPPSSSPCPSSRQRSPIYLSTAPGHRRTAGRCRRSLPYQRGSSRNPFPHPCGLVVSQTGRGHRSSTTHRSAYKTPDQECQARQADTHTST